MKILHTSDLHLNSAMNTKLSAEKAHERRRELLSGFRKMTEYARQEKCTAFIIAGDLFDSERPAASAKKYVIDVIESSPDILFFYLPGNHEKRVLEQHSSLPKNLYVFGNDWTSFSLGDVIISGRAETSPEMFKELNPPENAHTIAVLHGELRDKSDFGGVIGRRELADSGISYLALGHYHSYACESIGKTSAVYAGAPDGRGFDEAGEKGFVIIDTDGDMSHRFVSGFGRGICIKEVEAEPGISSPILEEKIIRALSDVSSSAIVRVILTGKKAPEDSLNLSLREKHLSDRFYYFEIKDETGLLISREAYELDKSLKGEFIRLVLSDDSLDEHEKDRIINCGLSALMGEKFDD